MTRIYLDSNVFRYLKSNSEYARFVEHLHEFSDNLLYCYSHAHILDLQNDTSEKKWDDLIFMESFVKDNYLLYDEKEKRTSCYLASPTAAFGDGDDTLSSLKEILDFDKLFESIDSQNPAIIEQKIKLDAALDIEIAPGIDETQIPDSLKQILTPLVSDRGPVTMRDLFSGFAGVMDNVINGKGIYKNLRNQVTPHLDTHKYQVDYNSIDFNDDLKNTVLGKTFLEFVTQQLNPKGDKAVSNYDFHTTAYMSLDLLGISKEKSKNVKFRSLLNDAMHSYYGAYCDYLVTDDEGLLKKSKILYKLFGIETKVLHINDLAKSIFTIGNISEPSSKEFLDLLTFDMQKGLVLGTKPSLKYNRNTTTIQTAHLYLGLFNRLQQIVEDVRYSYLVLFKARKGYSDFLFYKEYSSVIKKALALFGNDIDNRGQFSDEDKAEMHNGEWKGRHWLLGKHELKLEINQGTNDFDLVIGPIMLE